MSNTDYPHGAVASFGFRQYDSTLLTGYRSGWVRDAYISDYDGTMDCLKEHLQAGHFLFSADPSRPLVVIRDVEVCKVIDVRRAIEVDSCCWWVDMDSKPTGADARIHVQQKPKVLLTCVPELNPDQLILYTVRSQKCLNTVCNAKLLWSTSDTTDPRDIFDNVSLTYESETLVHRRCTRITTRGWMTYDRHTSRAEIIERATESVKAAERDYWRSLKSIADIGASAKINYEVK